MPVSKTQTKQATKAHVAGGLLARLEAMVEEQDLCDINHAVEILVEDASDVAERGREYEWNMREHKAETVSERKERVRKAMKDD